MQDHEKLFDEISEKLQALSHTKSDNLSERLEKMQVQFRRSQEELKAAQQEFQDKINSLDTLSFSNNDLSREVKRVSEQLDQERMNNSKLSTDLAKSLELNLRLQFEIEEVRSKASQYLNEEKKHNIFLQDKVKTLSHELDLAQALSNETRLELAKAKEKYQTDSNQSAQEKKNLQTEITDLKADLDEKKVQISSLAEVTETLKQYEEHTFQQHELMKNLSEVAEKKMIELKMALDKKSMECQDYYSHLQQAMTQIHVFRQENTALKDYISKLTALHQQKTQVEARPEA